MDDDWLVSGSRGLKFSQRCGHVLNVVDDSETAREAPGLSERPRRFERLDAAEPGSVMGYVLRRTSSVDDAAGAIAEVSLGQRIMRQTRPRRARLRAVRPEAWPSP